MGMVLTTSFTREAEAFGFNQPVPLDLTEVGVSNFPTAVERVNNAPLQANSAFGQGTSVSTDIATTLEMALVAAGIADGGTTLTPHVMQQIRDSSGILIEAYRPTPVAAGHQPVDRRGRHPADAGRGATARSDRLRRVPGR